MSRLRIAHLSDPHFGTLRPGVCESLLEVLRELKPDLILLTGDITQRATAAQFREAHAFAQELKPVPTICVPGNHDIPLFSIFGRLFDPYRGFRRHFKYKLEKDHVQGDVVVTGLNSASRWRHVQGHFNLRRVEKRLTEKSDRAQVRILAFHHPVDCAKPQDEKNLLKDAEASMELFGRHGIDLIVGGHIHDPYVSLSNVRYPKTGRNMVIAVAGTCLSSRTRKGAPNSFNLIDVNTESVPRLGIVRYDLRVDGRFSPQSTHRFVRIDENGWAVDPAI